MFDLLPFHLDVTFRQVIIIVLAIIGIYLLLLVIPGVGSVVKHITHTISKYIIHPLVKYVFEAAIVWFFKMLWWGYKYLMFAFVVYFHNLTKTHERIYPALNKKQIGVINDE